MQANQPASRETRWSSSNERVRRGAHFLERCPTRENKKARLVGAALRATPPGWKFVRTRLSTAIDNVTASVQAVTRRQLACHRCCRRETARETAGQESTRRPHSRPQCPLTSADLDANDTPAADLGFSDSDSESEDSVAASEDEETAEPAASVVIEEATISKQPTESAEKEAAAADVAATKKETYSKKEGGAKEKSDPAPSSPAVEEKASKKKKKASTKKKSGEDVSSAAAAAPKKKKKKVATKKGKVTVSMAAPFGIGLEEDGEAGVKVGIVKEGKNADKTGKIKVGMKIVSINGISTVGLAKKEVSGLIKDCKGAGPVPVVFER